MEIYKMTWDEIMKRLAIIDVPHNSVYGIPTGGMIATAFLYYASATCDPDSANVILDDIIDTGATMELYRKNYPNKQFFALVDKKNNKTNYEKFKGKWIEFPWETDHPKHTQSVQNNIVRQLAYIGENPNREGLLKTPDRVVKSYAELYAGYGKSAKDVFTTFDADGYADRYDEIVLLKEIELYSNCEHHMLPFFGKAHIAYIPDKKIVGISKLARLLDIYARRLQIQERIGDQVTTALMEFLEPKGAACIIEATHMCMRMRGVSKQNSIMTTSSMKGVFLEKPEARQELMNLIK